LASLPADDFEEAQSFNDVAIELIEQGKYAEAEEVSSEALRRSRATHCPLVTLA
jgi:hypothetical protein